MLLRSLLFAYAVAGVDGNATPGVGTFATWMDFKDAAVSIVFDDNSSNQFEIAEPLMNARNIRGTFFVVPDWCPSIWDSIKAASRAGHEIGSHTMSHPDMSDLADSDITALEKELKDSKDTIEKILPNVKCLTLARSSSRKPSTKPA